MNITDSSGEEVEKNNFLEQYIKKSDGIILVYSLKDAESFEETKKLLLKIKKIKKVPVGIKIFKILVICANKCDEATIDEKSKLIIEDDTYKTVSTSSKTSENINEIFLYLLKLIIENKN
jgi:GTPase SAR1 family protein